MDNRIDIKKIGFAVLMLCLLCLGCDRYSGVQFEGTVSGAEGKFVTVSLIHPNGEKNADSVQIRNGVFQLNFPVEDDNPHFFEISLRNDNAFTTLAKRGETLCLEADASSLVRSYQISGSHDAELMQQLDRRLSLFADSAEILLEWFEIGNDDSLHAQIERAHNQITANHAAFLRQFIQDNPQSLSCLAAFYQRYNRCFFLHEEENIELLETIHKNLQVKYPDSEDVKWVGNRLVTLAQRPISESPVGQDNH